LAVNWSNSLTLASSSIFHVPFAGSDWAGACNVGTGTETSVIELAAALRAHGDGAPFELEFAPARTGEIERSAVDPALAREVLSWEARVGLAEGLERTLAAVRG